MHKLAPIVLAGCIPITFSGSNVPTDHTFKLTDEDIAAATSETCAQDWIGDDPQANLDTAMAELEDRGVKIAERKAKGFSAALPGRLFVGHGFGTKPVAWQVEILSHELVHYCQRDALGIGFERAYAHSAGRWRLEVPAWSQSIRTMAAQGANDAELMVWIDEKLISMRDSYFLHDIDPGQYEIVTRRIWESEL